MLHIGFKFYFCFWIMQSTDVVQRLALASLGGALRSDGFKCHVGARDTN